MENGKLKERNERARQFALKFDWGNISKIWIDLFEKEG